MGIQHVIYLRLHRHLPGELIAKPRHILIIKKNNDKTIMREFIFGSQKHTNKFSI